MGQWVRLSEALYETRVQHCDFCGKMLVKRLWSVDYRDRSLSFCNERCEATFFDYWLPRYGKERGFAGEEEE